MRRQGLGWAHVAVLAALLPGLAAAQVASTAQLEAPRPFGYWIGDTFTQTIRMRSADEARRAAQAIQPRRLTRWIERTGAHVEQREDGAWLAVHHQMTNAPRDGTIHIALPAWSPAPGMVVPAQVLGLGSMLPAGASPNALPAPRPDQQPTLPQADETARRATAWAAASAASLLAWLGWWLWQRWRDAPQLPLEAAWRRVRRGRALNPDEQWRTVHHALNTSAGAVLQGSALAPLFERCPWLQPAEADIQSFFAASSARFFQRKSDADARNGFDLLSFLERLRRLERRGAAE